jgi:hypothetical protein
MKKVFAAAVLFLCTAAVSFGWNCPAGQIRQQAPAGTPTTTPYYDVVEGIAFICVPATPTTPSTPGSSSTSSANSNSSSQSSSNSSSSSKATGGNATAVGQGGAGGSVNNSGNSSNTNVNTAQGGAGGNANQKQTQSQTANGGNSSATASGNGVGNGNNSNDTNVVYPKQVATAIAPEVFPTVPCFKGFSGGVQSTAFGASFGGGKIDQNCAELEAARQAPTLIARCKVYLLNKYVKQAGVTMEDCLAVPEPRATIAEAPAVAPAPQIVVNVPPIVVPTPQITVAVEGPAVAEKPLPPPVKQRRVHKPCPANKASQGVFTDDSFQPFPEPVTPVCE